MTQEECIIALRDAGHTVAVAESCTGGALGAALTAVPGSSRFFCGGVIAYANDVKHAALGVPYTLLDTKGAVSEEVAIAMAEAVRELCHADIGISLTGIAGPDGGTPDKPVGTVWFACSTLRGTQTAQRVFSGDRHAIRSAAVAYAVAMVYHTGEQM